MHQLYFLFRQAGQPFFQRLIRCALRMADGNHITIASGNIFCQAQLFVHIVDPVFVIQKNVTVRISHPFFTGNTAADRLSRRLGIQKKQIIIAQNIHHIVHPPFVFRKLRSHVIIDAADIFKFLQHGLQSVFYFGLVHFRR